MLLQILKLNMAISVITFFYFRYDTGHGPRQMRHPNTIRQDRFHQVIAKKTHNNTILIVDGVKSVAAVPKSAEPYLDLSGKLYVGFVPQNFSL